MYTCLNPAILPNASSSIVSTLDGISISVILSNNFSFSKCRFADFLTDILSKKTFEDVAIYLKQILFTFLENFNFNTTESVIVKLIAYLKNNYSEDLKLEIDNMSVTPFSVEDSIAMLTQKYNEDIKNQDKLIESYKDAIKEQETAKSNSTNALINMSFNRSKEYSINEFKGGISKAKSKKEEITKSYNAVLIKYENRDPNEVIFNVFKCRLIFIPPKTGIRKVISGSTLFTPNGKMLPKLNANNIEKYLESKNIK